MTSLRLFANVPDPHLDPDPHPDPVPQDPYVLGIPDPHPDPLVRASEVRIRGSGSVSKCHGSPTLKESVPGRDSGGAMGRCKAVPETTGDTIPPPPRLARPQKIILLGFFLSYTTFLQFALQFILLAYKSIYVITGCLKF